MDKVVTCRAYSLEILTNGKWKKILNNVFFDIYKNETLAIVGPSGSGKTMIIRSILSLFEDVKHYKTKGSISYIENGVKHELGINGYSGMLKFRREKVSFVPQQSANVLNPSRKIEEELNLSASLANRSVDINEKVKALEDVGFENPESILKRYPYELSGGQVQRVLIASALMRNASLMLVDEPTSNLDEELKVEILELLTSLKDKYSFTLLIVTHELDIVDSFCDRMLKMQDGVLIECHKNERNDELHSEQSDSDKKQLTDVLMNQPHERNCILRAENIDISFRNERWTNSSATNSVVKDLNLELFEDEVLGIVGPSGSGKSSVAKVLTNIIEPKVGTVYYCGNNIKEMTRQELSEFKKGVQIIFQDPLASLTPHLTVGFLLSEVFSLFGLKPKQAKLEEYILRFGLEKDILERRASEMSGGQRQRVLIARALIGNPKVLICDEILASLDVEMQNQILEILFKLKKKRKYSMIFISHDMGIINRICDRKLVLGSRF